MSSFDALSFSAVGTVPQWATAWYGLFAPSRTPEPALHRLQTELAGILKLPPVRKSIVELGAKPGGPVGVQFGQFQKAEIQRS